MRDEDLKMTPGDLEAVESAEAYANRVNQRGVASERPERDTGKAMEGAPTEHGAPTDNGEIAPAADSTVREGDDVGGGKRAHREGSDPQNPFV